MFEHSCMRPPKGLYGSQDPRGSRAAQDVEARLSKVKLEAGRLQSALARHSISSGGIAGTHAKLIFKDHFFDRRLPRKTERIKFAIELSTSIFVACDKALKAIDAEKGVAADGHMGRAWREWVQADTRIAKDNKLPIGVRKDNHPGPGSSRFLALVRELQRCVSEGYRRRDSSDDALAQDISRARRDTNNRSRGH